MTNEALVQKIRSEDGHARRADLGQLYEQNTGLVFKASKRFDGLLETDDAMQECYLCMLRAVDHYEPEKGATFASFFYQLMTRHLYRCIGATTATAAPEHVRNKYGMLRKAQADLTQELGRDPDRAELARHMGITLEEVEQMEGYGKVLTACSLDAPLFESDDGDVFEFGAVLSTGIDETEAVEDQVQREELAAVIWAEVDALQPRQAAVIRGRYQDGETLKEIGQKQGISKQRAQQIENDALKKLREGKARKTLTPFLSDKAAVIAYRGRMQRLDHGCASTTEAAALEDLGELSYVDYIMEKYGRNT